MPEEKETFYDAECLVCGGTGKIQTGPHAYEDCPRCYPVEYTVQGDFTNLTQEQKVELWKTYCQWAAERREQIEPEPELICPLRMLALERTTRIVKADSPAANGHVECLKDKCAWWHAYDEHDGICALLLAGDSNLALYGMLDEIRGKL